MRSKQLEDDSEHGSFLAPNSIKIAVESNWNSEVFQKLTNLGFLGKNDFSSEFGKRGKFAVESVSNDVIFWKCIFNLIIDFFCMKSVSFFNWKIKKKLMKKEARNVFEQNAFILKKGVINIFVGPKICRWWPGVLLNQPSGGIGYPFRARCLAFKNF